MPGEASRDQSTSVRKLQIFVAKDVAALAILGMILAIIHYTFDPFVRGFFCADETIRYPHKSSTISSGALYASGTSLNILLILLFEYIRLEKPDRRIRTENSESGGEFWKVYLCNVYARLVIWGLGAISSELITDIAKVSAGRLRPHFIDVCQPQVLENGIKSLSDYCSEASAKYKYITKYECSHNSRDIRMSFMSGHSSYAAYSAIHAVLYLQSAVKFSTLGLLRCFLQVILISMAFYTGLSRISDYKHHWQDVVAGLTQGTCVAYIVTRLLFPLYHSAFNKHASSIVKQKREVREEDAQDGHELDRVRY